MENKEENGMESRELLSNIEEICNLMDNDFLTEATNEQLIEYMEQTNKTKSILLSYIN